MSCLTECSTQSKSSPLAFRPSFKSKATGLKVQTSWPALSLLDRPSFAWKCFRGFFLESVYQEKKHVIILFDKHTVMGVHTHIM